jgi:hypothetical protein
MASIPVPYTSTPFANIITHNPTKNDHYCNKNEMKINELEDGINGFVA